MIYQRRSLVCTSIAVAALLTLSSFPWAHAASSTVIPGITETQPWLQQQLAAWAPSSVYRMDFGAPVLSLSYGTINSNTSTPAVIDANINMLEQSGMNMVRFDIGYDAWLSNDTSTINALNGYVRMVNASGKLIVIADAAAERYRPYPQTWTNFQLLWLQRVRELASLYHPYAYIVVKEPGWYYPMISDAKYNAAVYDANSWGNLTAGLVKEVKDVSPQTKVGVAIAAYDLYNNSAYQGKVSFSVQYLQHVEKIAGLDFIAFDIYDIAGFLGTQRFLTENGNGGKAVWIGEAWSGDGINLSDPTRAPLDALWIQVLYYFAQHIDAQAMLPFYSDLFASYETPPTTASGMLAFYQQRTPVFYEYQNIISSNAAGELPSAVSSSSSASASSSAASTSLSSPSTSTSGSGSATQSSSATASSSSGGSGAPASTSQSSASSAPTTAIGTTSARQGSAGAIVGFLLVVGLVLVVGWVIFRRRARA